MTSTNERVAFGRREAPPIPQTDNSADKPSMGQTAKEVGKLDMSDLPPIGTAAPSAAPVVDARLLERMIKERVDMEVTERLRALEADDPTREQMTQEDKQFSNFDKKLEVFGVDLNDALPGMKLRWFNDDGDRIMRMQVMGYTFVKRTDIAINDKVAPLNQDLGENVAVYVGKKSDDVTPMRAFLMRIPNELFEKRYARSQEHNDRIEDAIRHGSIGNALSQGGYPGTDMGQVKINYNPRAGMARIHKPS